MISRAMNPGVSPRKPSMYIMSVVMCVDESDSEKVSAAAIIAFRCCFVVIDEIS